MHIAQRKELDVHKTKQKRDRNRTTTSLVLDSRMQRGRWEFRLNQRIWLRLSSVFERRRISFFKIFLVSNKLTLFLSFIHHIIYLCIACNQTRNPSKFHVFTFYMSRDMRFPTVWYVLPAKAQTSLRICAD